MRNARRERSSMSAPPLRSGPNCQKASYLSILADRFAARWAINVSTLSTHHAPDKLFHQQALNLKNEHMIQPLDQHMTRNEALCADSCKGATATEQQGQLVIV